MNQDQIMDNEFAENFAKYAHFSRGPKECYMTKHNRKSQMARNEGNESFKQSKFYDALLKYNYA